MAYEVGADALAHAPLKLRHHPIDGEAQLPLDLLDALQVSLQELYSSEGELQQQHDDLVVVHQQAEAVLRDGETLRVGDAALTVRGQHEAFEKLLRRASVGLALTFIASAPVNFALALYILRSPPGTPQFNEELGKMHWVGPLVIAVPSTIALMIVFTKLMNGLGELSGLSEDEIFHHGKKPPPS